MRDLPQCPVRTIANKLESWKIRFAGPSEHSTTRKVLDFRMVAIGANLFSWFSEQFRNGINSLNGYVGIYVYSTGYESTNLLNFIGGWKIHFVTLCFFNLKTNCFQLGVYSELFNLTLKHLMTIKLQNKLKKQEDCLLSGKTCHDCLK